MLEIGRKMWLFLERLFLYLKISFQVSQPSVLVSDHSVNILGVFYDLPQRDGGQNSVILSKKETKSKCMPLNKHEDEIKVLLSKFTLKIFSSIDPNQYFSLFADTNNIP